MSAATRSRRLAAAGYDVVVYDDLSAGHREAVERIAGLLPGRSVTLVEGDMLDGTALERAMADGSSRRRSCTSPRVSTSASPCASRSAYYKVNVTGTLGVLAAMAATGVPRSCSRPPARSLARPDEPIDEDLPQTTRQRLRRNASSRSSARCLTSRRATGIRWTALRYFNAAGRRRGRRDWGSSRSGDSPDPARDRRRGAAAPTSRSSATTTRRRTARASATTCTSATWPTPTSGRSAASRQAASLAHTISAPARACPCARCSTRSSAPPDARCRTA